MEKQLHFCLCKKRAAVCLKWRRLFLLMTRWILEGAEGALYEPVCPCNSLARAVLVTGFNQYGT